VKFSDGICKYLPCDVFVCLLFRFVLFSYGIVDKPGASDVPRILEWEGAKCRRRRGGGEGISHFPLGEGSGKGAVPPPQKIFRVFC